MNHGRQLRLFLADGTGTGPRFYEIVNRTIQALSIPASRIKDLISPDWPEMQKSGIYLVYGSTEDAQERLYIGKGDNVAKRVQVHPEGLKFDVISILLFTSKDENLNASQVAWLESKLVTASKGAKRIGVENTQNPTEPALSKGDLATVQEFLEDLLLISQSGNFDFFSPPKQIKPENPAMTKVEFLLKQPTKNLVARGHLSDEGFVVKAGSDASATINEKSLSAGYASLRENLIGKGVLLTKDGPDNLLTFAVDYAFTAPSAAAAVVVGNNASGNAMWKTHDNKTLGDYLDSLITL